ncbi:MAG: stage V sporulation protein AB [Defluviitaleaceae bacterium]|nr:stage V sporulation protein AB [Defluviitaleaceae bacterium]
MIFLSILLSFSLGVIVSGAIFSFISMIGVVPRLAQKTKTIKYIKFYEEIIIFSGVLGASSIMIPYNFHLPVIIIAFAFLCNGIFIGCLAVSLTEILDVIPIMARRIKALNAIRIFMIVIAIGKSVGTFLYFFINLK